MSAIRPVFTAAQAEAVFQGLNAIKEDAAFAQYHRAASNAMRQLLAAERAAEVRATARKSERKAGR